MQIRFTIKKEHHDSITVPYWFQSNSDQVRSASIFNLSYIMRSHHELKIEEVEFVLQARFRLHIDHQHSSIC